MQDILTRISLLLMRLNDTLPNNRKRRLEMLLNGLHLHSNTIQNPMINLDDLTDYDITKLLKESAPLSLKQFILVLLILLDKSHCEDDSITKYLGDLRVLYDIHKDRMSIIQIFLYNIVFEIIQNNIDKQFQDTKPDKPVTDLAVMGYEDPDWLAVKNGKGE